MLSNNGAKAPSFANKDLSDLSCSKAFILMLSKSIFFHKKTVLVKIIIYSCLTQFRLQSPFTSSSLKLQV